MEKHKLSAQPRQVTGRKVKQLRRQGMVPANVFGKKISSSHVQIDGGQFSQLYPQVGESTLVYLQIKGEKTDRPVFIRQMAVHPVSGQLLHVAFQQVDLKEKVVAPVAVRLTGEAPAEKDKLGILVQQLDEVEIEALPADMPEHLTVDVAQLAAVDDAIKIGDLQLDQSKLTLKTAPETIIVKIEPLAAEEKVPPPVEATVAGEPAVTAEEQPVEAPPAEEAEEKKD